ncbi:putative serine/threonine-protein kinase, partial [Tetrabaena socialis]
NPPTHTHTYAAGPDAAADSAEQQEARLTNPRWLAPEVILAQRSTQAGDVYSFGIIMYELLTWLMPYGDFESLQVVVQHSMWNDSLPVFRPDLPPDEELPQVSHGSGSLAAYKQLMAECWAQRPEDRPSFSKAAVRLQTIIHWEQAFSAVRASMAALLPAGSSGTQSSDALPAILPKNVSRADYWTEARQDNE